jgi:hypothetical protein
MVNATEGEKYDFKVQGMDKRPAGMTEKQYKYRGSVNKDGLIGSARDFGNIGAGYVAGRFGLTWSQARFGFDAYQSYKSLEITRECTATQKAQKVGYINGKISKLWWIDY